MDCASLNAFSAANPAGMACSLHRQNSDIGIQSTPGFILVGKTRGQAKPWSFS
jgi:hypothetical protein